MSQESVDRVPVNRFLGFRFLCADGEAAVLALDPRIEFIQNAGFIQGGILAALADLTAAYAVWPRRPAGHTMMGMEFKMNFLRPARLDAGEIRARGTCVHAGKRTAVSSIEMSQAGKPVALGTFSFVFLPEEP
jgi:uncharacterized protein (TIGR00369 family)